MAFHVGQKVTPKDDSKWQCEGDGFVYPQFGCVYTIRSIEISSDGTYLLLHEIRNPPANYVDEFGEMNFWADEFRPIVDPKAETSFTTGAPKDSETWDNRRKVKEPV